MPVSVQVPFSLHTANGVTTVFAYGFFLLDAGDMVVKVDGVTQTSGFTITGLGSPTGGTVVFGVAPVNNAQVLLQRTLPLSRATDYQYGGDLLETTLDNDFDRLWQVQQQLDASLDRSIKLPEGTSTDQNLVGDATARAGKFIAADSSGNAIWASAPVTGTPVSAFMGTVLDDVNGAAALTTIVNSASAAAARTTLVTPSMTVVASGTLAVNNNTTGKILLGSSDSNLYFVFSVYETGGTREVEYADSGITNSLFAYINRGVYPSGQHQLSLLNLGTGSTYTFNYKVYSLTPP